MKKILFLIVMLSFSSVYAINTSTDSEGPDVINATNPNANTEEALQSRDTWDSENINDPLNTGVNDMYNRDLEIRSGVNIDNRSRDVNTGINRSR